MIEQIDHIGIAVKSLEDGIRYYEETLGLKCEAIEEVASATFAPPTGPWPWARRAGKRCGAR